MARDSTTLARRAQAQGWDVKLTNGGHLALRSPEGELIHTGSTPSDWNGQRKNLSRMRKAGYQVAPPKQDPQRESRMAKAITQQAAVLAVLQEHAGQAVDAGIVADEVGLERSQATMALYWLKRHHPEVTQPDRGLYVWKALDSDLPLEAGPEETEAVEEPEAEVPAAVELSVDYTSLAEDSLAHNDNGHGPLASLAEAAAATTAVIELERPAIKVMPSALPKNLPAMFEAVSTDGKGRLVLRDENGGHWLAVEMKPVL